MKTNYKNTENNLNIMTKNELIELCKFASDLIKMTYENLSVVEDYIIQDQVYNGYMYLKGTMEALKSIDLGGKKDE